MQSSVQNCWEIMRCGRQGGGANLSQFGECVASVKGMGHSCWELDGTLCDGVIQGTAAVKVGFCLRCPVYAEYNRTSGRKGREVQRIYPDEDARYRDLLCRKAAAMM